MRVNRPVAILVALLTLAPWAYLVFFFSHFMTGFPSFQNAAQPPEQFFRDFDTIFRLHMIVIVLILALMAFYIVHLFRTDRVPGDKKALWAVVLFLGNLLAMPVYWYLYVWPKANRGSRLTGA
jgi:magnesium-transporting ATPase (P-type)